LQLLRLAIEDYPGDLTNSSGAKAVYFVQWTVDEPGHMPICGIVIGLGPWALRLVGENDAVRRDASTT
jgi:hypothetical protein